MPHPEPRQVDLGRWPRLVGVGLCCTALVTAVLWTFFPALVHELDRFLVRRHSPTLEQVRGLSEADQLAALEDLRRELRSADKLERRGEARRLVLSSLADELQQRGEVRPALGSLDELISFDNRDMGARLHWYQLATGAATNDAAEVAVFAAADAGTSTHAEVPYLDPVLSRFTSVPSINLFLFREVLAAPDLHAALRFYFAHQKSLLAIALHHHVWRVEADQAGSPWQEATATLLQLDDRLQIQLRAPVAMGSHSRVEPPALIRRWICDGARSSSDPAQGRPVPNRDEDPRPKELAESTVLTLPLRFPLNRPIQQLVSRQQRPTQADDPDWLQPWLQGEQPLARAYGRSLAGVDDCAS